MTDPVSPKRSAKRAKLCSIENANRVATQVADRILSEARAKAYEAIAKIDWPEGFHRTDIGWRAL